MVGLLLDGRVNIPAHRHHGNVTCDRTLSQVLKELPPVVVGHGEFGDDDVRVCLGGSDDGLRTVCRRQHVESRRGESERIQCERFWVAIHEEDQRPWWGSGAG